MQCDRPSALAPFQIIAEQDLVLWADLADYPLMDPFFRQSLARYGAENGAPAMTPGSLDELAARADPGYPTSGVIFHVSRCGSTLLSRALASMPDNLVLSEAQPVNTILDAMSGRSVERRAQLLRGLISAYAQGRSTPPCVYLKCTNWHMKHLPLVRVASPEARWVFLYRDPVEVLASQARKSGGVPFQSTLQSRTLLEAHARTIAQSCYDALEYSGDSRGALVNYQELCTEAGLRRALRALGSEPSEVQWAGVVEQLCWYSKRRDPTPFSPDGEAKQAEASSLVRQLAERWLEHPYRLLEAAREGHACR